MNDSLNLKSLDTLQDLQIAFGGWSVDTKDNLRILENDIQKILAEWKKRVQNLKAAQNACEKNVAQAELNLQQCQSLQREAQRLDVAIKPDIGKAQQNLRRAREALRDCNAQLVKAKMWLARIEQAAQSCRREARRVTSLATHHTEKARSILSHLSNRYIQTHTTEMAIGAALNRMMFAGDDSKATADKILSDNTGKEAEEFVQLLLISTGIRRGDGAVQRLKKVIPGQYSGVHGIDLIGITDEGIPVIIEVKKRGSPDKDTMSNDVAQEEYLEEETVRLRNEILRERELNPSLQAKAEIIQEQKLPDTELSTQQMGGLWARDRWLKLIKRNDVCTILRASGVGEKYLDCNYLVESAYIPEWNILLNGRTTVIVSRDKDDVTNALMQDAVFKRGFDVNIISLPGE